MKAAPPQNPFFPLFSSGSSLFKGFVIDLPRPWPRLVSKPTLFVLTAALPHNLSAFIQYNKTCSPMPAHTVCVGEVRPKGERPLPRGTRDRGRLQSAFKVALSGANLLKRWINRLNPRLQVYIEINGECDLPRGTSGGSAFATCFQGGSPCRRRPAFVLTAGSCRPAAFWRGRRPGR